MARPGAIPRVIAACIAAATAGALVPVPPARAADADPLILPGRTAAALATDVDGVGGRDIVRLRDDDGPALRLEVWRELDTGWVTTDALDVPSPVADEPDLATYALAAGLIEARQPDGSVPLVVAAGADPREYGPTTCCLSIHRLRLVGDQPALETVANPGIAVDEVFVVDLDGDAVDEVVVGSTLLLEANADAPVRTYTALRWDGGRYVIAGSHEVDGWSSGVAVADTDGRPGFELVLVGGDGVDLVRLALNRGVLSAERTELLEGGWLVGAMGSRLVIMGGRAAMYEWPSGQGLALVAEVTGPIGDVFGIVGRGADALLLTMDPVTNGYGLAVSIDVYDAAFEHLARIEPSADAIALDELMSLAEQSGGWNLDRSIWPYIGPIDWSDDAPATWMLPGHAVMAGGPQGLRILPAALLTGFPVGQAGIGDGWLAVCDGCWRERDRTALYSDGMYGTGQLALARTARLLTDAPIEADVTHPGALLVGSDPQSGITELLGSPAGFALEVTPGPGVAVVSWDGRRLVDHGTADGEIRIPVAGPEGDAPDDQPFERTLIVIAPDGRVDVRTWRGTFAPAEPTVTAEMHMSVGSLDVEVSGTASELATVIVDGHPVTVAPDGQFRTTISAAPWPAAILVTATDPFGSAVEQTVEVIGLVDYRGLPWGAIAIVATLGAAAALFLRVPHLRGTVTAVGDGSLEEIDADPR